MLKKVEKGVDFSTSKWYSNKAVSESGGSRKAKVKKPQKRY